MKKILFIFALSVSALTLNAQLTRHGLVLNGGIGRVDSKLDKTDGEWTEFDYKAVFSAGYRLRFNQFAPKTFHYDFDVNIGTKRTKPTTYMASDPYLTYTSSGGSFDHFTSISGTANYAIIKNLSLGLGVEPSYFFKKVPGTTNAVRKNKFDIPVVAKITYSLKVIEFEISGKYGLVNVMEVPNRTSGKYRELQFALFIPF